VAAGAGGFLRRGEATTERLVQLIGEVDRGVALPPGLLRRAVGDESTRDDSDGYPASGGGPGTGESRGGVATAPSPVSLTGGEPEPGSPATEALAGQVLTVEHFLGDGAAPAGGVAAGVAAGTSRPTVRLSERELEVLRLVGEGYDTAEVAEQLSYSESTIKGVLAKVMARLDARNRSHAVAVAVRGGLI